MKGILADHNADGHVEVLLRTLLSDDWLEMWNYVPWAVHGNKLPN
jgi:hypothetical protein